MGVVNPISKNGVTCDFAPRCWWCQEPIDASDQPRAALQNLHSECGIRRIVGSLAHLERRCSCHVPGSAEADPPGMSKRKAALKAVELWRKQQMQVEQRLDRTAEQDTE